MPERDDQERQPTRVGRTPWRDKIVAKPVDEDVVRAEALVDAVEKAGLPLVRSVGKAELTVHAVERVGANAVRLVIDATHDGRPVPGWDRNHVIVNPRLDISDGDEIREDPLACVASLFAEYAARRATK